MDKEQAREDSQIREEEIGLMPVTAGKPTVYIPRDLRVILSPKAFAQLFAWAYATHLEISCLGTVTRKGTVFEVDEFFLVDQVGSGAHTELDPEALVRLVESLRESGRSDDAARLRCWAHSHPGNMGTFWSTTDDETSRLLAGDYLVSVVVANGFRVRARVDLGHPVPVMIDHLPVSWRPGASLHGWKEYQEEVDARVAEFQARPARDPKTPPAENAEDAYCGVCDGWHERDRCPFRNMFGVQLNDEADLSALDVDPCDIWF